VQTSVKKSKEPKHPSKANQLRNVKNLTQRCDGEGDNEKAQRPITGCVLNELQRIGNRVTAKERPNDPGEGT
jgi:hypothetical protein